MTYIQAVLPSLSPSLYNRHCKVRFLIQVNRGVCSKMKYLMLFQSNPLIISNLQQLSISLLFWPLKI